jgi:HJR/Mrr/RecB family endonuclease
MGSALLGFIIWRKRAREKHQKFISDRVRKETYDTVSEHMRALVRKRFQTLRHDDYGNLLGEPWEKEITYFMETVLSPRVQQLGYEEYAFYVTMQLVLRLTIDEWVKQQTGASESLTLGPNLTPTDYEQYCAGQLRLAGWSADTTKASGDQGTDIVAQKGDLRLVVQCKLYSHPVGNKAVQEIAAARAHERADYAAVVSNSRYTSSAQQLAKTNGILLLHHTDLRNIDDLLDTIDTALA